MAGSSIITVCTTSAVVLWQQKITSGFRPKIENDTFQVLVVLHLQFLGRLEISSFLRHCMHQLIKHKLNIRQRAFVVKHWM